MKNRRVKVELVGGVGNQLFQVFAGISLAKKNDSRLVIDTSLIGVNGTFHKSHISDFDLSLEYTHSNIKRYFQRTIFARVYRGICRRSKFASLTTALVFRRYQSLEIGFDEKLLQIVPPITISGYFQTPKYFDALQAAEPMELRLKQTSFWLKENLIEMTDKKILGIHVRRGDYKKLKETFGLLDHVYYEKAIAQAFNEQFYDEIWLFSDEPQEAKTIAQKFGNIKLIEEPQGSNPLEAMILLSKCHGIVISNSTFAWWAAKMSLHSNIYIPSPWFKNERYSKELIIHEWTPIEPSWEN